MHDRSVKNVTSGRYSLNTGICSFFVPKHKGYILFADLLISPSATFLLQRCIQITVHFFALLVIFLCIIKLVKVILRNAPVHFSHLVLWLWKTSFFSPRPKRISLLWQFGVYIFFNVLLKLLHLRFLSKSQKK
jgi:hypothetical protein